MTNDDQQFDDNEYSEDFDILDESDLSDDSESAKELYDNDEYSEESENEEYSVGDEDDILGLEGDEEYDESEDGGEYEDFEDSEEYADDAEFEEYDDGEEYGESEDGGEYEETEDYEDGEEYDESEESEEYEDGEEYDESEESEDYEDGEEYDESGESEEYEDGEYGYDDEKPSKKAPVAVLVGVLLLLLILFGIGGFMLLKNSGGTDALKSNGELTANAGISGGDDLFAEGNEGETIDINFDENGGTNVVDEYGSNNDVITVTEANNNDNEAISIASGGNEETIAMNKNSANEENEFLDSAFKNKEENNSIVISINKAAKANPFKPPEVKDLMSDDRYAVIDSAKFEIVEPPVTSMPDENLTKLLKTQISGIMYDKVSPSAIVNLNGTDYFVKKGDVISGYTITNITEDKVQITYKNNSYVASVGQLFTQGFLDKPAVANLDKKFAGRKINGN